ncbi:MAG: hypothetical protein NTZ17_07810 [Phycisphaerae bacterium]|nr:hypothetical protein [Phycisphaerae bacterium]
MGNSVNPSESGESPTVLLRRLHHWRMAFFGLIILLAGMLSGAAVTLLIIPHLGPDRPQPPVHAVKMMLTRLSGPLHLTPEQRQQVEPILKSHMTRLDQIQGDGQKVIAEELRLMSQQMAGVLTEDQMRLWERLFLDLPGSIRHIPQELGPGYGRGPAPPGGWRGPPAGRGGPPHMSSRPTAPDANTVPHN